MYLQNKKNEKKAKKNCSYQLLAVSYGRKRCALSKT